MPRLAKDQPLYEVMTRFRQQCLLDDLSLFWPKRSIWTLENLREWKSQVYDKPVAEPALTFTEKLEVQMEGAAPDLWALTAEMLYIYFLPSSSITFATKMQKIQWAAQKTSYKLPEADDPLWDALKGGFVNTGILYHQYWPQLTTLNAIALALKQEEPSQREALLSEAKAFQHFIDEVVAKITNPQARAYDVRHILLYLIFPERYEPIISTGHKHKIAKHYHALVANPELDLDDRLLQIREALSEKFPQGKAFHFYDPPIKAEWDKSKVVGGGQPPDKPSIEAKQSLEPSIISEAKRLLERYKNLILYGPPGTGKTYWAQRIAEAITSPERIYWVTFHPSYAYEDFIEGLRPLPAAGTAGNVTFEVVPGIFRRLCQQAAHDKDHNYILIIDEINRGNLAKIFGELITLLEADKRDKLAVSLPYSQIALRVPSNLWLIGTMNTTDRSIALLDMALRRRFAFMELLPEPDLLSEISISSPDGRTLNLGKWLQALNKRIARLRGADYQIGHSYFLPLRETNDNEQRIAYLEDIWNYQVFPLLKEYFYGQPDLLRQALPFLSEAGDDGDPMQVYLQGEYLLVTLIQSTD